MEAVASMEAEPLGNNQTITFIGGQTMRNYDYENRGHQWLGAIALSVIGVFVLVVSVVGFVFMGSYNDLVDAREDVNLARANVQTMMQRRLELIPDLVEVVEAAAGHEEKVFGDIAAAEAALTKSLDSGDNAEITEANNKLSEEINNLIVLARDYPTLTAGQQYTSLMDQLEGSVNRISIAREAYNEEVSSYNRKIDKAPTCFIASAFGFEHMEEFEADEAAEQTNLVHMNED